MNTDKQKISILDIGKWYSYTGTPTSSTSTQSAGIDVMVVSQNEINNTSLVRIRPWAIKTSGSGGWNTSQQTLTIKANNSSKTSKTTYDFREATTGTKNYLTSSNPFKRVSGSGTLVGGAYVYDFTITHNDDGSKNNVSVYALIPLYNDASGRNWTVDIDIDLPKIPRLNRTIYTYTYLNERILIGISKSNDSFTTTINATVENGNGTTTSLSIANKTADTGISYYIPENKLNEILSNSKNAFEVEITFTEQTYSGTSLLGTDTTTLKFPIKNTPPIVSATYEDTNATTIALTGNKSKIIKYISQPKVVVTATPQQMADIVSYSTIWGNSSSTTKETTFINGIDSNILQVSAKDSRNWVGTISYDITENYIEYIKLGFEKFTLERPETTSNTINANINGIWFNGNFGVSNNTIELKFRYKEKDGEYGGYQTVSLTTDGNTFKFNGSIGDSYNYQKQYDFEFILSDKIMSLISTFNVTSGESIIRVGETYVRILGDVKIKGNVTANDELINKQIGDIVITSTNENPSERLGGTWELVDKDFIEIAGNFKEWFTSSSNVTLNNFYVVRSKHSMKIRLDFTNKVALNDTSVLFGNIDYNSLGITDVRMSYSGSIAVTDGGNGIAEMNLHYSSGELSSVDVITKTSGGQIAANSSINYLIDINVRHYEMLDEACDKFYWKKTA